MLINGNWNILKSVSLSLQAIINSTILPNMTFTKTSQKFGQWSDARANTVFGLGFPSEAELNKVSIFYKHVVTGTIARIFFVQIYITKSLGF